MSYQLYRNTTLGHTLQESLDELIQVTRKMGRCHRYAWKPETTAEHRRPAV